MRGGRLVDGSIRQPGFGRRPTRCRRAWAVLSDCGKYRYRLGRDVSEDGGVYPHAGYVLWIILNPSTADGSCDDNTIRRCIGYTRAWGYSQLLVGNLYAFRSTDPTRLWKSDDPYGPENRLHLCQMACEAALILVAWGQHAKREDAEPLAALLSGFADLWCLGVGGQNKPKHPLMLSATTPRVLYLPKRLAR